MRYQEIATQSNRVGREYQHLEDLVFVYGSQGARAAVNILEQLAVDSTDVAVKWDGNPTVYWGRDQSGTFVMTGKNGWGKNKSTSADQLAEFIMTSGRGEDWRASFAESMASIFPILKDATPKDFRGYLYGDLLWHPAKPCVQNESKIQFTPNKVTYIAESTSALGNRVKNNQVGIAAHQLYENFGDVKGRPAYDVEFANAGSVTVFGQTPVLESLSVNSDNTARIVSLIEQHAESIDSFLEPRKGLSDIRNIVYTYVNQTVKANQLSQLTTGFFDWLATSKVSENKRKRIADLNEDNVVYHLLNIVSEVMQIKNTLIEQLDISRTDLVEQTGDAPGGEGYVLLTDKIKLVPRHRWTP